MGGRCPYLCCFLHFEIHLIPYEVNPMTDEIKCEETRTRRMRRGDWVGEEGGEASEGLGCVCHGVRSHHPAISLREFWRMILCFLLFLSPPPRPLFLTAGTPVHHPSPSPHPPPTERELPRKPRPHWHGGEGHSPAAFLHSLRSVPSPIASDIVGLTRRCACDNTCAPNEQHSVRMAPGESALTSLCSIILSPLPPPIPSSLSDSSLPSHTI